MIINFYLPNFSLKSKINGGYKVVYQYANFLASNHNVNIYYDIENGKNRYFILKKIFIFLKKIRIKFSYPTWFKLDKRVKKYAIEEIKDDLVKDEDISIATAFETAQPVDKLSHTKGKKIYFIQDYEIWNGRKEEELLHSYKLNMKKIVISHWLKNLIESKTGDKVKIISNGIDTDNIFKITNPIEERYKYSIMMLYHNNPRKGCVYGLEVLKRLKEKYPEMKVLLFGSPKNKKLPKWIKYKRNLTELEVAKYMNQNSVYLCTSLQEGYGLPGIEAMACGCALVTTECNGNLEYANETNSLISKPKDTDSLYNNICVLFENDNKRIKLAKKGNEDSKSKNINLKFVEFENYLLEIWKENKI